PGESQSCTAKPGPSNSCFKRGISPRIARTKRTSRKTKTAGALLPAVARWARPTSYLRAHLCPPFFISTPLHPCIYALSLGWSERFRYWTLVVHKAGRPPDRGQATAGTLRQNAKPEEYGRGQSSGFGSTSKATLTGFE